MQAIGITITINSILQTSAINKIKSTVFSEILLDERWEGVAFIALYDKEGNVALHSNPALIGQKFQNLIPIFQKSTPYYHYITLGTGEKVFVADTKINLQSLPYLLRVALHTYPAEGILRKAKIHILFMIFIAMFIIIAGFLATILLNKMEKMQIKIRELENLSMLSRVLAHEIRNPLGSIKGFVQYLIKKISEPSLKLHLEIILKESLRLERLTNDLMHYGNPQSIKIERINLKELIYDIALPFIMEHEEISFDIDLDEIHIDTDKDKIAQILNNILDNAISAVSEIEPKKIIIKAKRVNDKIKIEISDTGTGMDEETLKKAVEPFFTTKPKGTGLGLAIVTRLCEILKINFEITSKKGQGTRVCLTMPKSL